MKGHLILILAVCAVISAVPAYALETTETDLDAALAVQALMEEETEGETEEERSFVMGEETMDAILDALEDETWRKTRKFFKDGGVIEYGYRGDAGAGLQKMLVALGCGISVDGAVGAKTMEALHQVQERFQLEPTDKVDLAMYDTLLPLLFLAEGKEDADIDLAPFYDAAKGEGYYEYLKGCALEAGERYYSAMEAFESSSYKDSRERAKACRQEYPSSGEIWRNPDIPGSDASLTFSVNTSDDSQGMCFMMYNLEDQLVSVAFVRGNDPATANVPVGTYHIKDGTGYEWYGVKETFGPDGYYEYLTFSDDEDTRFDVELDYGSYALEVNVAQIEEGATSVGSSSVGWNE